MRIETMRTPSDSRSWLIPKESIVIGRASPDEGVDLVLADDAAVSRVHARLRQDRGMIWVEDLGSANGTMLNRVRLQPGELRPVLPSDRLEVGDTVLAVGTDRLIHLRSGSLSVLIESLPLYSHAFHHSAIPLVSTVAVWNLSSTTRASAELSVSVPGFGDVCVFPLEGIAPGERRRLEPPASLFASRRLETVSSRTRTSIQFSLSGGAQVARPLGLLSAWEWPHLEAARILLAAHVLPGEPVVRRIVREAAAAAGLPGGVQAPAVVDPQAVLTTVRTIYEVLVRAGDLHYAKPVIQTDPDLGLTYQFVRSPDAIFASQDSAAREADCLDLSLLMAGCLEQLEIPPVILLAGERPDRPDHAMVGYWTDGGARFRPLLDQTVVLRALSSGELRVVEATGVCEGSHRLAFDAALTTAEDRLRESRFIHAVDVVACRVPQGRISPLQLGLDPVVAHAYHEAEVFRARLGITQLETSHLLRGMLAAGGSLIQTLLSDTPGGVRGALERFDGLGTPGTGAGAAEPTVNYNHCQEDAVRNARLAGSSSVRECDLLWAILVSGSMMLDTYLYKLGLPRTVLAEKLRRIVPPLIESTRPQ